ncbi:MAG: hypothetical protein ACR5K9_09760 [Wolbachia sp.]
MCKKIKEGESRINRELEIIDFTVKNLLEENKEEEVLKLCDIFNLKELGELFSEGSLLKAGSDITMSYSCLFVSAIHMSNSPFSIYFRS